MAERERYRNLVKALGVPRELVEPVEAQLGTNAAAERALRELARAVDERLEVVFTALQGLSGMVAPPWTDDPPDETGWYWWRDDRPVIVEVVRCPDSHELIFYSSEEKRWMDVDECAGGWSGPLWPPESDGAP